MQWQVDVWLIDIKTLLTLNQGEWGGKPTWRHYWFLSPRVIWCLGVSRGHSVLTSWPSVLQPSLTKASDVAHMTAVDHPHPPPSLPPSLPSCSHCLNVIWQTKRLFIQSRNKTPHPPFTLRLSNTPTNAATFSKTRLSAFFYFISKGRELLTPDQRGYHSKHGRHPNRDTHPVCACVCVRVWFVHEGYEKAHCGHASVPN